MGFLYRCQLTRLSIDNLFLNWWVVNRQHRSRGQLTNALSIDNPTEKMSNSCCQLRRVPMDILVIILLVVDWQRLHVTPLTTRTSWFVLSIDKECKCWCQLRGLSIDKLIMKNQVIDWQRIHPISSQLTWVFRLLSIDKIVNLQSVSEIVGYQSTTPFPLSIDKRVVNWLL